MIIRIDIDSKDLFKYTTSRQDEELAEELIRYISDGCLLEEVKRRHLIPDVLDSIDERELEEMLAEYGYTKE